VKLYKSTVIIWSEFDPNTVELSDLAQEAETGVAYCSSQMTVLVDDPKTDPEFGGGADFFDFLEPDEDDHFDLGGEG
jgi:hypothetical protein